MVSQAVLPSTRWRSSHHGRSESRGRKGQHSVSFILLLHSSSWVMKCYGPNSGHTPPPLQLVFSGNTPTDPSGKPVVLLIPGYEMCYECSSGLFAFSVLGVQAGPSARQSSVLLPSDNHNSPVIPKRKVMLTLKHFSIFPIFLWCGFTLLSTS